MSSSGTPTPNHKLNQWQASDKPERMDFNSDNQKIDAALSNKAKGNAGTGAALNSEKVLGTDKIMTLDGTGRVQIPDGADVNNYIEFGAYCCVGNGGAETLTNAPFNRAFSMDVVPGNGAIGSGYRMQIARDYANGTEKKRCYWKTSNQWVSDWRETAQIEYGTWTPTMIAELGTNPTATYTATGTYTKIGKFAIVTMDIYNITITNAGSGYAIIGGIPFVARRYSVATVQHYKELYNDGKKENIVNVGASATWDPGSAVVALRNAACNYSMRWAVTAGQTQLGFLRFSICAEIM